jgi:calcium/calmodulin-dependent protein kinase (CaM kinase) II
MSPPTTAHELPAEPHDERTATAELLVLSQQLLDCITNGDWETYVRLCDPTLTAFEPEARGERVEGLDFHRYYFDLHATHPPTTARQNTLAGPRVCLLGSDAALVTYVRLVQGVDESGKPQTARFEETRVWRRCDGQWRHMHFHRSANS